MPFLSITLFVSVCSRDFVLLCTLCCTFGILIVEMRIDKRHFHCLISCGDECRSLCSYFQFLSLSFNSCSLLFPLSFNIAGPTCNLQITKINSDAWLDVCCGDSKMYFNAGISKCWSTT